jgi:hypothetical protein
MVARKVVKTPGKVAVQRKTPSAATGQRTCLMSRAKMASPSHIEKVLLFASFLLRLGPGRDEVLASTSLLENAPVSKA